MKTLKKTLCLVLAVVMVVGVLILPVNADYADDAKIDPKYETAVNVLTTVGVFEGKTGNNFDPTGILTRSEAAKILAYIKVGKDIAESYPAAGAYSDVPKDNWAAKYIAYGTSQGIINGVGGDKFDPTGTLTGTQLAKMLLVAIEYNATYTSFSIRAGQYFYNKTFDDRYVGDLWEINTITDLSLAGLNVGLETVDLTKSITREQAAQMVLNAVKFQRSTGLWTWVTGPDGTTRYQRELYTQPLLETALDVVVNPYCHDAQGVPYVAWEYMNEEIYTEDYEYVGSYDNAFDKSAYSALGGEGHVWYNGIRDFYGDGKDDRTVSSLYVITADTRAKYGLEVDVYAIDIHYTGSGYEYPGDDSWHDHLYSSDGTTYYDIVVKEAYLAKVTYVDEKSVEFDVYEAGRMIGPDDEQTCKITSASPYFEALSKLAKGDYFAAYLVPDWDNTVRLGDPANVTNYMIDYAELETVTGDITRTVHGKIEKKGDGYAKGDYVACRSTLDVGGETYKVNNEFINLTSKTAGGSAVPEAGNNVTMYLLNGNVLGLKINKKPIHDNLIMVTDIYLSADANGKVRPTVEGVNTAGEKVKFFVSDDKTNNDIEYHDVNDKDDYVGSVYAYKASSIKDGCYVFGKLPTSNTRDTWTTGAEWDAFAFNAGTIAKTDKTLPAAWTPYIKGTTDTNFYYDANVKFIYSNGAVAEGVQAADASKTLLYPVIYLEDGVYYVKAVFVYGKPASSTSTTAYFIEKQTIDGDKLYTYLDADGKVHDVADVPAWKDGVKTTLKIDVTGSSYYANHDVKFPGGFYSVKTAFKGSDDSTIYSVASASTANYGAATYVKGANLLVIGTTQYNVKSTTVIINTSNGRELEISDIENGDYVGVQVAKDTSDLTYVYVTNDAKEK